VHVRNGARLCLRENHVMFERDAFQLAGGVPCLAARKSREGTPLGYELWHAKACSFADAVKTKSPSLP
jgi:hypothetical protein